MDRKPSTAPTAKPAEREEEAVTSRKDGESRPTEVPKHLPRPTRR